MTLFFTYDASAQFKYQTSKPWSYWWWMGSAVNKTDIKQQLIEFKNAGLGGVHIVPIYGVKGYEKQFKSFLSEEWLEMVQYTINEAKELGLGVDMTLGTAWPFGGRWITSEYAAKKLISREFNFENSDSLFLDIDEVKSKAGILNVVAIYAFNGKERLNLKDQIKNAHLNQKVAYGDWKLNIFGMGQTEQMVKRAAPGGEGLVMDYFDQKSVNYYLNQFDTIFTITKFPIQPRAFYHDSYEVYRANWTGQFLGVFKEIQNYDLLDYLYVLEDRTDENYELIVHDVRETLSELLYSEFTKTWTEWTTNQAKISRNQAHGSPSNLLDLYALADIPETEAFGCSDFSIPNLSCDPDYRAGKFGRPNPLMMKFASSPAHLLNKPLVSSETATWLADHFKVPLKRVKPQIDELFTAGINHVFYHGITYSPKEEGFPGWLFYASTNFGQSSHFWDEFPLLNAYIKNCQEPLQEASSDNDILLYFPINDIWTKYRAKKRDILFLFDVHHYKEWFSANSFGKTAELLWDKGYTFDYVSDKQIAQLGVDAQNNVFISDKAKYKTIIVPKVDYIQKSTLEELRELADQGVKIIFVEDLPKFYSGFPLTKVDRKVFECENFTITSSLEDEIHQLGIEEEELKLRGLEFIRKRNSMGNLYFITNLSNQFKGEMLTLSGKYNYISITDPLTNKKGYIKTSDQFYLNIPPGKSLLVQTSISKPKQEEWKKYQFNEKIVLNGKWKVRFEDYESHQLKPEHKISQLKSWTEWGDEALKTYSGKAHYVTLFSLNSKQLSQKQYILHVDEVRETANVIINGVDCGTIWSFPNQLEIPADILQEQNKIEIVVQNLSSNYMKKYDTENPGWKKFYDINFVNITYDKFSTDKWKYEPSGIIGNIYINTHK
ncbi:glycosyl hydrolase [Marinifilum caeruleilacunae]|uniref:Glycoside hydrolase n=1 Tax=Marinifilum caeruleilacunae TaxID=2499076 RepID=A0ABX1WYR7_9BACT|nr:glycosyl hydrolase [Marinifilum caeruleilacunae]NOU61293.1 glycoside hydrolase [Marinifilum caeruleilacunae]